MGTQSVLFGKEGMEKLLKGMDTVANAVAGTMGPKGRNVYFQEPYGFSITNDGATIANKITLEDPVEEAGGYTVKNVTGQQNDDAGDGTTTVAVLLQSIIHEALKRPENPMLIKESLAEVTKEVLTLLKAQTIAITKSDIEKVALISAEDPHLAKLITEIINKLGEKAVINVEDSKTFETNYEIVDGYEAHVGFMSPHFITEKNAPKAIYTDIPVLVSEKKIANIHDIKPVFEKFKQAGISQCVIVCDDIDDSMLGILVQNKLMGTFQALVIRASAWLLKDIEGAVGAKAISDANGISFQKFELEHLGHAKKVVCDANKTLFTTDGVTPKQYASILEQASENEPNQYQQKKLKERAAQLRGGVAVLRIGANTDFERDYKRRKAEDAVKAVQAALEEGVVEGGGMALWRIAHQLDGDTVGYEIMRTALQAPMRKIIENVGKDYTTIILNFKEKDEGYDAKEDSIVNLIGEGIIDPAKVERCAVENAVSAASTFITTFCAIVNNNEPKTS